MEWMVLLMAGISVCAYGALGHLWTEEREVLIGEIAEVIGEFLAAGEEIRALSGGNYQGTISARLRSRGRGRMGYTVSVYDSGACLPKGLAEKYGKYYDAERDAVVYVSRHTVRLGQEKELEDGLHQRLCRHPLAEVWSNAMIYTKGMERR